MDLLDIVDTLVGVFRKPRPEDRLGRGHWLMIVLAIFAGAVALGLLYLLSRLRMADSTLHNVG